MNVLGIETTCDETACAVVKEGRKILSNVVTSQIDLHSEYGGVVPELACRRHVDVMIPVIDESLKQAQLAIGDLDLIAVSQGPGLIGALLVGIHAAKVLSWVLNKPMIGVNHIEAHLYAAMMSHHAPILFPCLGVVISGGHTALVLIRDVGTYELIGQTVDDAIGEAFDKVAKILGLPYPGGPQIEKLAKEGDPFRYSFKPGIVKGHPFNFSFSGLKTAVLYASKGQKASQDSSLIIPPDELKHIAASFQMAAFTDIIKKTLAAAKKYDCCSIVFGGGVTCNERLKEMFVETDSKIEYLWPSRGLSLDNAAMIAGLGYHRYRKQGFGSDLHMEASTEMPF